MDGVDFRFSFRWLNHNKPNWSLIDHKLLTASSESAKGRSTYAVPLEDYGVTKFDISNTKGSPQPLQNKTMDMLRFLNFQKEKEKNFGGPMMVHCLQCLASLVLFSSLLILAVFQFGLPHFWHPRKKSYFCFEGNKSIQQFVKIAKAAKLDEPLSFRKQWDSAPLFLPLWPDQLSPIVSFRDELNQTKQALTIFHSYYRIATTLFCFQQHR